VAFLASCGWRELVTAELGHPEHKRRRDEETQERYARAVGASRRAAIGEQPIGRRTPVAL